MSIEVAFSVGPVQAFVGQARRTRDFWGGSYLLSFLTAHAIRGALVASAKVHPEQLEGNPLVRRASGFYDGEPQSMGSVPNHFAATASDLEHAKRIARAAEDALREAWKRVCDPVWVNFVAEAAACGISTRGIWERQVSSFWEIAWVAGDNAPELLARRKRWRTHWPPDEPGDKCSVMSTYQELSGHIRAQARVAQDAFWARVRKKTGELDIQQGERLCAIALVKRLYAKCAEQSIGWRLDTSAWPSTVDFAALPWVRRVLAHTESNVKAQAYAEMVRTCAPAGALERARHFRGLDNGGNFVRLNGDYIHPTALANSRVTPLGEESNRQGLRAALAEIAKLEDAGGALGYPPRYYALLLADGDKLGNLLRNSPGSASAVGVALDRFTSEAGLLSDDSDAVRVYAGGDDIFALLPLEGALVYADRVALKYRECFVGEHLAATLSGAVVFAQMTVPLTRVLAEARRLLDDVAKEQNGRNSLAVGVCQGGGITIEWVSAWDRNGSRAVGVLERLVAILKGQKSDISSSAIHRIHALLWRLLEPPRPRASANVKPVGEGGWRPGRYLKAEGDFDVLRLIFAEILHSLEKRCEPGTSNQTRAEDATAAIWDLLKVTSNEASPGEIENLNTDGLRLAVFLAGGGNEEEHQ